MTPERLYLLIGIAVALAIAVGVWVMLRGRKQHQALIPPDEKSGKAGERLGEQVGEQGRVEPAQKKPPGEKPAAWSDGLARTRGGFVARIAGLLSKKEIGAALLEQLEEVLLTADIGVKTSQKLFEAVKTRLDRGSLKSADAVWESIRDESRQLLALSAPPLDFSRAKPFVILTIGVNGAGKTTTIGKLAARFSGEGKKVLLAAGDTFRAAATEQLEVWGQRSGCEVVKGREGGDPSSVIFDAVKRGKAEGHDIVIADTAGRLHTKTNLMEELQKVRRVIQKVDPSAPHETILVLDATNGQNAIAQAQMFKQAMDITGIVLTKLDGTAKGGVILGICDELRVPVRFVGIGEKVVDLRAFDAAGFVDALYQQDEAA